LRKGRHFNNNEAYSKILCYGKIEQNTIYDLLSNTDTVEQTLVESGMVEVYDLDFARADPRSWIRNVPNAKLGIAVRSRSDKPDPPALAFDTVRRPTFYFVPTISMDVWRLLGYARTSFYSHVSSLELPAKDQGAKRTSLLDFCKSITPICRLNPLLFNGHLQTFWTAVKSYDIPIYYKRRIFSAEDPAFAGTFAVDFVVGDYEGTDESLPPRTTYYKDLEFENIGSQDAKPMLVTLHGLSGGSHEIYLRHVLRPVVEAGWEACVVNSRGCAMSKITTGVLYNARATWDIRQIVKWLRQKFPNRPLFGLGFSLGANILVNVRTLDSIQLIMLDLMLSYCAVSG